MVKPTSWSVVKATFKPLLYAVVEYLKFKVSTLEMVARVIS